MRAIRMSLAGQVLLAGVLAGGVAWAQGAPGAGQEQGRGMQQRDRMRGMQPDTGMTGAMGEQANAEPKKHLTEVDVYLRDAMNNAKTLYQMSQMPAGKLDKVIEREGISNIDRSLNSALTHIGHVRSMPEARIQNTRDLGQLQNDLTMARTTLNQLRKVTSSATTDRQQVAQLSSQLFTQLQNADQNFGKVADSVQLSRIEKMSVPERQPVRGTEEPKSNAKPPSGGGNY